MSSNIFRLLFMLTMRLHLQNLLVWLLFNSLSFRSCVKWHISYSRVTHKNQWTTLEYSVHDCQDKIELYCMYLTPYTVYAICNLFGKIDCSKVQNFELVARKVNQYTIELKWRLKVDLWTFVNKIQWRFENLGVIKLKGFVI